ncbi:MAG: DUF4091 domain-containing protein [Clostridia bacterium]|nr:DUF4091 domain-containing protein [Clostridia bacterium]
MERIIAKAVSATEKCFLDESISEKKEYTEATMLLGERFSFQVAYHTDGLPVGIDGMWVKVRVEGPASDWVKIQRIESVPVRMPINVGCEDKNFLRTEPGLYPDLLKPYRDGNEIAASKRLQALWVDIYVPEDAEGGRYPLTVTFFDDAHGDLGSCEFVAEVIPAVLPDQEIAVTQWFHPDCLAVYYGVEMFSEEHWAILAKHIDVYTKNGLNMILTPVFTPALDTVPGGERPTCQLVDVYRRDGKWSFGFERLERWVGLCLELGIEYFEISHLFTQWGAKHAPKVMAHTENGYEKVFGWETDACGEEYPAFLKAFIPALIEKLEELGVADCSVFHISDEPGSDMLDSYNSAKNTVTECLKGQIIMDALSDYSFYEKGVVEHPVVATDHIDPYINAGVPNLWAYYCCCQINGVSNRMIAMSTARNRIIGQQLYKYDIAGFLQWGFNFYFTQGSREFCDPYQCNDGGWWVPAGDTFSVYPAHGGGAYETVHLLGFTAALTDLRAFKLCEELCSKEEVMAVIEERGEITFKEYPRDDEQILSVRERINRMIANKIG